MAAASKGDDGFAATREAMLEIAAADLCTKVRFLLAKDEPLGDLDRVDLQDRCDNVQKALDLLANHGE